MRRILILISLPLFLGGKPDTKASIDTCNCDTADTLNPDTLREFIAPLVAVSVDSFRAAKQSQLDELIVTKDSLALELHKLKMEKGKKLIVGRTDEIPGETWKWLYWKYPNGTKRFYKVYKIKH